MARLIVKVPAEARVYIDGHLMQSKNELRAYDSPALASGQSFYYDLRVELNRDGKLQTVSKHVTIRAGEVTRTSFPELETVTTARR